MDTKRLIIGTIVGGIVLHIVGYLIFDVAAADFYAANEGPASGAFRDVPMQGSMFVANLAYAALITLGLLSRGTVPSIGAGALIAAVIGLLVWLQAADRDRRSAAGVCPRRRFRGDHLRRPGASPEVCNGLTRGRIIRLAINEGGHKWTSSELS